MRRGAVGIHAGHRRPLPSLARRINPGASVAMLLATLRLLLLLLLLPPPPLLPVRLRLPLAVG